MNPDELLAQIGELLAQYLSMGPDTPVAPEAEALMAAIEQTSGGGVPPQGPPPEGMPGMEGMPPGMPPMPPGMEGAVPDLQGMMPSAPPTSNGGAHPFADVSAMAIEDMKKRQKTKA